MGKKTVYELNTFDMIINSWECNYSFHVEEKKYAYKDYDYDGYDEMLFIDIKGKPIEEVKSLKIDSETVIELLVYFSSNLGSNDRVGMAEKNKHYNILQCVLCLPLKSREYFISLLSANKFKRVNISTEKMKYNKALIRSFNIDSKINTEED